MPIDQTRPAGSRLPLAELLFTLLVLFVFADPLFFRRNFAGRDLLMYNLPVEHEIHEAYGRGALPVWSSRVSGGRPVLPNPNMGALYPVRPLLAILPFPLAFRVFPVLHWIAAGLGMIRLARSLGAGRAAAWMGAVTYVFSGVGISEVYFTNHQPGVAMLPWVVWAAVRPVRSRADRILPAAILLALDFYAGDVFTIGSALVAWVFWLALESARDRRMVEAGNLGVAAGLAGCLALPQIVATALWAPWTHRAVGALKLGEVTAFSIRPWRLLELLVPYPFGPTWSLDTADRWAGPAFRNFFPTLFCGGLAVLALPVLRRRSARGTRFVLAFAAAIAAACVLPSFLPVAWLGWRSPIPLRYPEKLAVGVVFALALGVALGLDTLARETKRRGILWTAAALCVVALTARLAPAAAGDAAARATGLAASPSNTVAGLQIAYAFAEAGLLWLATGIGLELFARRHGGGSPISTRTGLLGLAILTVVPILAARRVAPTFPEATVLAPTAFARFAMRRDPGGRYRELDASRFQPPEDRLASDQRAPAGVEPFRQSWSYYAPSLWDRATVLNSDPDVGDLSRMESLRRVSQSFPTVPSAAAIFASLSLRHEIRWANQDPLPGFSAAGGDALQAWDESPSALPAVRIARRWVSRPAATEALAALLRLSPGEVVLEAETPGSGSDEGSSLSVTSDRPERLELSVDAKEPVWVFVLRGFWPYRTVLVDGSSVEPVPAQLAFSAIPVPAGAHRVVWTESIPGAAFSWLGPLAFLASALVLIRRTGGRHGLSSSG